ncbi:efflux RND transporter periplasmic adaptor subunit [Fulvivirga maritima]|uniref:efflux RND transporter periplasmic adaptor subunit n=1 Tax=Fulvivirga maritima TaxID=2904247 RepID=UPI001F2C5404|nr:efflux RND transporter periplasmic adaptor subunit [Fulvivirga maritima]UII27523.1 efflux RND transporter periplasmic adaptor subunit [Fulvivirga maritima]
MKLQYFLRKNNTLRYVLSMATTACLLSLWSCGSEQEKDQQESSAYKVSVEKVTGSTGAEEYDYSGNLEADNKVDLSFSVSGRVVSVNVEEGQHVKKGSLLASIEQTRYRSAFEIAEANYTKAADNFKRNEELHKKGSLPERDFIASQADLAQAKANKDLAAKDLADTRLVAPFTGVITNKITEKGAIMAPGSPAFTLTKTDVMYATASIAEGDIAHVSTGDSVEVTIPALNAKIAGTVNIINPQADNYSRTFEVKVRLANEDGAILPGMLAQLHINTGVKQNRITIPTTCILKDTDNIAYVFLAQPDHTAIKKRINISRATGLNKVIISSGLNEGDLLIVEGQSKLVDGSPIQY